MSERCLKYFCDVSSLYDFLDTECIALLEKAIWLGRLGFFGESLSIFEIELSEWMIVPVVVYEKAMVYQAQGKVGNACETLGTFIESATEDDLDLADYRLLELLLAFLEIQHLGKLGGAVKQIERTRVWLNDIAVTSYTDVQVSVASWYVAADSMVSVLSNMSRRENLLVPKSKNLRRPWAGLAELRAHLLGSGRSGEACLLAVKSSHPRIYSFEANVRLCREILAQLQPMPEDPSLCQKLVLINLQLRLTLLERLVEYGTPDEIQLEIAAIETNMSTLESTFGLISQGWVKRTCFNLRLGVIRIGLIPKTKYQEIYYKYISLAQGDNPECQRNITECYRQAAVAAKALYQMTGNEAWKKRLRILFEMKEESEFEVFQDILSPLMYHVDSMPNSDFDSMMMTSSDEIEEFAAWYESYERDYPDFSIPVIAHQTAMLKIRLYTALKDKSREIFTSLGLEKWARRLPTTLDPATVEHNVSDERQSNQETSTHQYLEGNSQMMNYQHLLDLVPLTVGKIESDPLWANGFPGQNHLVQWLKDDFRSGNLSMEELQGIFAPDEAESQLKIDNGLPHFDGNDVPLEQFLRAFFFKNWGEASLEVATSDSDIDLPPLLREINAHNISEQLCGPFFRQAKNYLWLRRREYLTSWLRRPSKVVQVRKDFVLMCVYELRARQFSSLALNHLNSEIDSNDPMHSWKLIRELIQRQRDCIATFDASPDLLLGCPWAIHYKMGYKAQISDAFFLFVCSVGQKGYDDINRMFHKSEMRALSDDVFDMSRELISFYQDEGNYEMLNKSKTRTAFLMLLKMVLGLAQDADGLLEWRSEGLRLLGEADYFFSLKLHRHRGTSIIESLRIKEDARTTRAAHFVPQIGLNLLRSLNGFKQEDHSSIWEWVQRSKAKALHSVMAWHDEQTSDPQEVNGDDLSDDIEDDKSNRHVSFDDLDQLAKLSGFDNVVFVDWFSVSQFPGQPFGQIFMIILKSATEIIVEDLGMTDSDILGWKGTRVNNEGNMFQGGNDLECAMMEARDQSPLKDLKPLVAPLLKHTHLGDLLVFCPSNYLHQIPLHALELPDGTVVIHRNPVVYCYSLSVLWYNFLKASGFNGKGSSGSAEGVALFGDIAKVEGDPKAFQDGRIAIKQLGDWFGVKPFLDTRATKSTFLNVAPKSSLVHFHTHVGSRDANPLAHSIELAPEKAFTTNITHSNIQRNPWIGLMYPHGSYSEYVDSLKDYLLTAGEVSNLVDLPSPCHVTLIACGGGRLRVHPGDEVMGLLPAFMMKGATSVVATLWSINDSDGANFTRHFYSFLKVEADKTKSIARGAGLSNMAKAFQAAIIEMDEDSSIDPFYWAGFVLHGWWMFKPPSVTEADHVWKHL